MSVFEIANWLANEAEEHMKTARSRRSMASTMREATASDLKAAKAIAEKMHGRKLPNVSATEESAKADAVMNDSIASKSEARARQLSDWAAELTRLTALLEDRDGLATFLQNDSEFRWYLTRTEAEKIADRIRAYLKEQK